MNWNKKAHELRSKHDNLIHLAGQLPEAARVEMIEKLNQADTMITALERDASEVHKASGADAETVSQLYAKTNEIVSDLQYELEALSSGNPTTVSAAVDATSRLVEKTGNAIKTVTSKIPVLSRE